MKKTILVLMLLQSMNAFGWVCSARSVGLFRYYYAEDVSRPKARAQALANCQAHHFSCFSTGCTQTMSLREAIENPLCKVTVWAGMPAADECWSDQVMTGYRDGRVYCSRVDVRCER